MASKFGILFDDIPFTSAPEKRLAVTEARAELMRRAIVGIREFSSWAEVCHALTTAKYARAVDAAAGYLNCIVKPFFHIIQRALTPADFDAAEFACPASNTVIHHSLVKYFEDPEGAALTSADLHALVRATFRPPASFSTRADGTQTAVADGQIFVRPKLQPLITFYADMCSRTGVPPLDAIECGNRIFQLVNADDPELLLVNRSIEYSADAPRNARHKFLMHEVYAKMKGTGRMLEFFKEEIKADEDEEAMS